MKSIQAPLVLLAATATALRLPPHAIHKDGLQIRDDDPGPYDGRDGPVAPDTVKNCSFYFTTEDPTDTCDFIEKSSAISHKNFVAWNPSVKDDCSGLNVGWAYCVQVDPTKVAPTSDSSKPTPPPAKDPSTTTSPSTTSTPSPVQDGIVDNCGAWYKAKAGDTCDAITRKNGFSITQFEAWNPALGDDCQGLWANFYYCVAGPGWAPSTKTAAPKTSPRSAATENPAPTPTQDGIIDGCNKWYKAKGGDNCDAISKKNGISSKDFREWNPAVEDDCSGLWANYYYCVSIPGHTPAAAPAQPSPKPDAPKPAGPPVQDGIVANCQTLYTAKKGDNCASIVKQYGNLDIATFIKWNPAVGEDCYNLWSNYGYCVGTTDKPATKPGSRTPPPPPPPPPTDSDSPTGCSNAHPEPTQPGALCECKKWYKVSRGDGCYSIAQKFHVTEDDLNRWNPGSNCQLWLNYNICVSA